MSFEGLELLGWGQPAARIRRVEMPLQVRAVALQSGDVRWVYVCAELCFITQSVRDGVRSALEARGCPLEEAELVLAATHTHSGPAGYAHALFYNLTNPGHCPEVLAAVVGTMVEVILAALEELQPGQVSLHRGEIPLDEPVAFNRAVAAFQRNVDAPAIDPARPETATNRDLTVLRIDRADGPRAAICWFAVHNTSVHFDNFAVHGDNKGVAAAMLEEHGREELGAADFVGIFAQGASGDVTPNYRPSAARGFTIGRHDDDFESARFHGAVQCRHALRLLATEGTPLHGLSHVSRYVDFDGLAVDPAFAAGRTGQVTGTACYGLSFIEGTAEGPGPLFHLPFIRRLLVLAVRGFKRLRSLWSSQPDVYGPMFPFVEAGKGGHGKAFGLVNMRAAGFPGQLDPVVAEVHRLGALGVDLDTPWTPSIVPVHLTRIGDFALASVPCEPTTTAGRRLAQTVQQALGVQWVQVGGYSNAYHGYVATNEEYQLQGYEASHTVFGQWTLGAYRTVFQQLSEHLGQADAPDFPPLQPVRFSAEEVQRRRYLGPPPARTWGA